MSQNLAGVTLLALGNGAPDVISSIVASDDPDSGIEFSIGALTGAGLFVSSFVISSVLFFAKEVKVNKALFLRDIIFYLIPLVLLLVFSYDNKITLWESLCMLAIYFL
jgi:sodium/potassium/calcium exchanger 6